jgi:hypothetical protein
LKNVIHPASFSPAGVSLFHPAGIEKGGDTRVRKQSPLSKLAWACAAGVGIGSSPTLAPASVLVDVRAFFLNGIPVANAKNIPYVLPGDTLTLRVYADITGSDVNPECLQSLAGSFLSTGGTLPGNLAFSTPAGSFAPPFGGPGSSLGASTDLDGDGDVDIGSNDNGNPAGFFTINSGSLTGPRSTDSTGHSVFSLWEPNPIPNGTEYTMVTSLRFVVMGAGGSGGTFLNFRPRVSSTGGFWSQDATEVSTDLGNGTTAYSYTGGQAFTDTSLVQLGPPVVVGFAPEPTGAGIALLTGTGLLARRATRRG